MENYFVERKPDSDTLIIAFTGNAERMMMDSFEFFAVTNTINCNRILLKDPTKRIYLKGIGGELNSMDKLLDRLKHDIKSINAKTVMAIGTSGGGFAAILYGHLLKVDFVHAFGPTTNIAAGIMTWEKFRKNYKRAIVQVLKVAVVHLSFSKIRKYLDLASVLSNYNGVTHYNIYVCEGFETDVSAANHLKDCTNLHILKQPCTVHNVVRCMIKSQKLMNILNNSTGQAIAN